MKCYINCVKYTETIIQETMLLTIKTLFKINNYIFSSIYKAHQSKKRVNSEF